MFSIIQPLGIVIGNCAYLSFAVIEEISSPAITIAALNSEYSQSFLCLIEGMSTVLFVICWLTVTPRTNFENVDKGACIPIFGVLTANSLWAGKITGSSMNPVNELITYFMLGNKAQDGLNLWIFIVGPVLGAIIGALFYRFVLRSDDYIMISSPNYDFQHYSNPSRPPSSRIPLMSQSSV